MRERILIHALIISDNNGQFLCELLRNEKLEPAYLSGFIGALKMFGEETLGKIKDISINGLDIDMLIVSKHDLIFIALMDSNVPHLDFREGCERALDVFYKLFQNEIKTWDGSLQPFKGFKELLEGQVERYFEELEALKTKEKKKEEEKSEN